MTPPRSGSADALVSLFLCCYLSLDAPLCCSNMTIFVLLFCLLVYSLFTRYYVNEERYIYYNEDPYRSFPKTWDKSSISFIFRLIDYMLNLCFGFLIFSLLPSNALFECLFYFGLILLPAIIVLQHDKILSISEELMDIVRDVCDVRISDVSSTISRTRRMPATGRW